MIRVRIAPSPTGPMHVGTARTALFNWLFAKKNKGVFIVRIEDTDRERSKKEYAENILEGLKWLGLEWDEGPIRQSERAEIYSQYIKKLLASGSAFYCYHTKEELEKEKEEQMAKKEAPRHVCGKRQATGDKGQGVIRFANQGGKVKFADLIRGEIEFDAGLLGDFSIAKDEQTPLYNLAAAIDDYEMKISHVIRGEDHISNTPKQLLIYKALGLEPPQYAHLSMILGVDKSKLSKRHGATALTEYREMGYLADAMFNFLALLGWSPQKETRDKGQGTREEIMTKEEIIEKFSLDAVQKSGAVFNIEKLDWMNGEYIRKTEINELTVLCLPYFVKAGLIGSQITNFQFSIFKQIQNSKFQNAKTGENIGFEWIKKIVSLEQERMKRLSEIGESTEFFFKDELEYDRELLRWKGMSEEELKEILEKLENLLNEIPEKGYTKEKLEKIIMAKAEEWGSKDGKVDRGRTLWPLRVALTGRKASPGPFEVAEILGKQKCLTRVREARQLFE